VSLLITFEGVEGCGKSLQAGKLYERLTEIGLPAKLIHEPGGVKLSEELALILKESNISPLTELFLFNASRSQLVYESLAQCLKKVISLFVIDLPIQLLLIRVMAEVLI